MLKGNDKKVQYYTIFTGKENEISLSFILPRLFNWN